VSVVADIVNSLPPTAYLTIGKFACTVIAYLTIGKEIL